MEIKKSYFSILYQFTITIVIYKKLSRKTFYFKLSHIIHMQLIPLDEIPKDIISSSEFLSLLNQSFNTLQIALLF